MDTITPTTTETAPTAPATGTEVDPMAAALAADNATPDTTPTPPTDGKPATAPQDAGKPAAQGKDAKPAEKPADKPSEKPGDKPETNPDEKPEGSEFAKAKKEGERRDRSWKKLEEDKETFRAEKAAITAELDGLRREVAQLRTSQPAKPATDTHGNTAETYDDLAESYEEKGETELAKSARAKAKELRQQTTAKAATASDPVSTPEFQTAWRQNVADLVKQDPTLGDPQNPTVVGANNLLADPQWGRFFKSHPDGIRAAVEVSRLMQAAQTAKDATAKLADAEKTLATQKAEIERLNGLLQPRGSLPGGPQPGPRKLDEMKPDEADAEIRRLAEAADRSPGS